VRLRTIWRAPCDTPIPCQYRSGQVELSRTTSGGTVRRNVAAALTASMRVMKALAFFDPSLATVKAMSKSIE